MKYVQITITKTRSKDWLKTDFVYPRWYDADKVNIVLYQNEWLAKEYAIWKVADDFQFTTWFTEVTRPEAEVLVDAYVTSNKDKQEQVDIPTPRTKTLAEGIATKRAHLDG